MFFFQFIINKHKVCLKAFCPLVKIKIGFVFQTTLAKIIAKRCKGKTQSKFVQLSATSSGVNDVKEVVKNAKNDIKMFKKRTVLFLDEIHRFNKLQQVNK